MDADHPGSTGGRVNRDGRIARGERTRWAIVDAHTALLRDGELRPTAKMISERAGISLRTLWLNYHDMEALMVATAQYWLDRDVGNWTAVPAELPLEERIATWCRQRGRRLEDLAPATASSMIAEPFSLALQNARIAHRERLHHDLAETFGTERGTPQHLALFVAANGMTWHVLRRDEKVSADAAIEWMTTTFHTVLVSAPRRQQ